MTRTGYVLAGLALLATVLVGFTTLSSPASPQGVGSPDAKSSRFQVASWSYAYPGYSNQPSGKEEGPQGRFGAYILDTESGEVFLVEGSKKPVSLGNVKK